MPTELQSHGEILFRQFVEAVAATRSPADDLAAASERPAGEDEEQSRRPPAAEQEQEQEEDEEARSLAKPAPLGEGATDAPDACQSEENSRAARPGAHDPETQKQSATVDEALEEPAQATEAQALLVDDRPAAGLYEVRIDWLGRAERWYTAEEVARHCTRGDLWLVVRGKVYDASGWVDKHPGGATALLRRGGHDASRDFDFHSKRGRALWEATLIGRVDDGSSRKGGVLGWLL